MMVDSKTVRKWLHDIANRAMPLGGIITLMRLGKVQPGDDQLQGLENKFEALSDAIGQARHELVASTADAGDSPELVELTYLSKCAASDRPDDLEYRLTDIRMTSAEQNAKWGITGYLLYFNGYFLQRLEGNPDSVRKLMSNILLDARHHCISVLSYQPIDKGSYGRWQSMFFLSVTANDELSNTLNQLADNALGANNSDTSGDLLGRVAEQLQQRVAE